MSWLREKNVDLLEYLPAFLSSDREFKTLSDALSKEHENVRIDIRRLLQELFVDTETSYGLAKWEYALEITPPPDATEDERRRSIILRLQSKSVSTLAFMGALTGRYMSGGETHIEEENEKYIFKIVTSGTIADKRGLKEALDLYKPAHLGYEFLYNVFDLDDETIGDGTITGDEFVIGMSAWFRDNIPYGIAPHLHYDGSWQYRDGYTYADFIYGNVHAYGDIVKPGTIQYEPYTGWQFIFDGLAQYDGTWQYNGTYRYNGERPWKILYNDFMDTLSLLIITMQRPDGSTELKDDVAAPIAYGEHVPYGCRQIGANPLPIDCGGYLKVTRAHPYGDTWQYGDAGHPKYNGNVQFGDGWQYSKGGVHYGIDTFITTISGDLVVVDPKLIEPPYGERFPEIEETVHANDAAEQAVLDLGAFVSEHADRHALSYGEMRYGNYASVGTENPLPVDNGGELEILKGHPYGAGRRYDYGVSTVYGDGMTYATMQFEGGETYAPRRYSAVL